jgi:hypothetical protein
LYFKLLSGKMKKSCQRQDPFQNINPNITLEIKVSKLRIKRLVFSFGSV